MQMKKDVVALADRSPRAMDTMPGTLGVSELRLQIVNEGVLRGRERFVAIRDRARLHHEVRGDAMHGRAVEHTGG